MLKIINFKSHRFKRKYFFENRFFLKSIRMFRGLLTAKKRINNRAFDIDYFIKI